MILNGWKEIAQHLGRGVRTVQRWEALGLPVRRPREKEPSAVVALSEELDEWLSTDGEAKPAPSAPEPASGPFKGRILLVDDDEGLLVTTAAILIKQGYEVRTARDGFEALAAMRVSLPDILISDLRMPNMSGFELLAVVRSRFPGIGVIAISGEFTPATLPALLSDAYVGKDANWIFELIEAVRELFAEVPLRSQPARPDSAPAWIPRSTNGYIVLTCRHCLRSFSVSMRQIALDEVGHESCIHCGQEVRYRIDQTVLPVAAELPSLLARTQRRVADSHIIINHTKELIRGSSASRGLGTQKKTGTE